MQTIDQKLEQLQKKIKGYQKSRGIKFSSTAYLEKYEKEEPKELLKERNQIFKDIVELIRDARERGWEKDEIREKLKEMEIPTDYRIRAERAVDEQEKIRERQRNITPEQKEEIKAEILYKVEQDSHEADDFAFLLGVNEKMMKEDSLRSMLEYGRHQGLTDVELIAVAVQTGVEHDHAKHLVENTLQDDVDRQFYRDEENRQAEYTEEYLEMGHHL